MTARQRKMSEIELDELKARNPVDQVAGQWVKLRPTERMFRGRPLLIGPCPLCNADHTSETAVEFECTADLFFCRKCLEDGDVVALVSLAYDISAEEAAARLMAAEPKQPPESWTAPPDAPLDLKLAFYPLTDLGNAERFAARNQNKLLYCPVLGWLWWDGKRWAREGADGKVKIAEHECVRAIQAEAKALIENKRDIAIDVDRRGNPTMLSDKLQKHGRASETSGRLGSISKRAEPYLEITADQLDFDPLKVNMRNGTLVISREPSKSGDTGDGWSFGDYVRLKPHDPTDWITKISPVEFDPKAERVLFEQFLAEVQPDESMRRFLQQWKGYSLTGDASEHCMALFIGRGRNGKSVFEDTTSYIAGDYAETVPIETFLQSGRESNANSPTPARALLYNARMVRTSEPNKGVNFDEGFVKLCTGGDPIQARHLNLPMFRFYPVLKLTISGNHKPRVGGTDEGIWSRVKLVPWEITIPPEKRDRRLSEKLRAEASGILNWMLDGLSQWVESGLVYPEKVIEATAEYRRDSDMLGRFLEVCVEVDPDGKVQSSHLLIVFNAWAKSNGDKEWSGRGLAAAMTDRGFRKDKSSVMYWLGIKLVRSGSDFVDGTLGGSFEKRPSQDKVKVMDEEEMGANTVF